MRRLTVLAASLIPLLVFAADDAAAQRHFGGAGFRAGGFHGGGFRPGGWGGVRPGGWGGVRPGGWGGVRPGGWGGVRPGFAPGRFGPGFGAGAIAGGPRWGGVNRWYGGSRWYGRPVVGAGWGWGRWGWGRRYYPGYYYGGYPWGWGAAGLAAGTAIGAAAAYPAYADPAYPIYSDAYDEPSAIGGYCATPVRTCALIDQAPVGTGCSCRVAGGRARGVVTN